MRTIFAAGVLDADELLVAVAERRGEHLGDEVAHRRLDVADVRVALVARRRDGGLRRPDDPLALLHRHVVGRRRRGRRWSGSRCRRGRRATAGRPSPRPRCRSSRPPSRRRCTPAAGRRRWSFPSRTRWRRGSRSLRPWARRGRRGRSSPCRTRDCRRWTPRSPRRSARRGSGGRRPPSTRTSTRRCCLPRRSAGRCPRPGPRGPAPRG